MRESEDNALPDGDTNSFRGKTGDRGVTTIAQVKNVLELIPMESSVKSVEEQILSMVHTVAHVDDEENDSMEDVLSRSHNNTTYHFQELLDNIPAPTMLCCRVARNLFLIHDPTVQGPPRTSLVKPSLLLSAWKEFTQQCVILGAKIDEPERATTATSQPPHHTTTIGVIFQHMDDQHRRGSDSSISDFPSTLTRAILRRFKTRTAPATDQDNETAASMLDDNWDSEPLAGGWDAEALTLTLGRWELQHVLRKPDGKNIRSDIFLATHWKDQVPDAWHQFCNVNALLEQSGPSNGVVLESFKETVTDEFGIPEEKQFIRVAGTGSSSYGPGHGGLTAANGPSSTTNKASSNSAAAADAEKNQKKRKWHEKFGAQRAAASVKK